MKVKKVISGFALLLIALTACNQGNGGISDSELNNATDSVSYALGISIGSNLKGQFEDIDPAIIADAIRDVYDEGELTFEAPEANQYLRAYVQEAQQRKGEENLAQADDFLEENKERDSVQVTESGLQYIVVREGSGEQPVSTDQVQVHYKGTLMDGTVFDSSYERGEPATFQASQVIPGWTEALQMMKVGAKWKLFIPPDLGYGERGAGQQIGPNEVLIFEVELLDIVEG